MEERGVTGCHAETGWLQLLPSVKQTKTPLNIGPPKRNFIFQPLIFRGHVSFIEGIFSESLYKKLILSGFRHGTNRYFNVNMSQNETGITDWTLPQKIGRLYIYMSIYIYIYPFWDSHVFGDDSIPQISTKTPPVTWGTQRWPSQASGYNLRVGIQGGKLRDGTWGPLGNHRRWFFRKTPSRIPGSCIFWGEKCPLYSVWGVISQKCSPKTLS